MDRLIEPITPSGEGVPLALMRAQGRLRREVSSQICRLRTAPLRASIFAPWALTAGIVMKTKGGDMEKNDIEELRARVGCAAVLEHEDFAIDRKESTRRAVKFWRDDDIVIHGDRGWFDARSDVARLIRTRPRSPRRRSQRGRQGRCFRARKLSAWDRICRSPGGCRRSRRVSANRSELGEAPSSNANRCFDP